MSRSCVATRHGMLLVGLVPWVETHGYCPSPLRGGGMAIVLYRDAVGDAMEIVL